ncbi:beta-propeller fold lactonase family protein [Granulicella sp. dw_53]|uniref:lactonase family protein n=1 Tax=Granulicella sp. dw_53 TaxID=2719792 RepID=UPI001BD5A380|nr:beta-propeller fold lactonase family protein [Granulicella sp. dw_53]
MRERLMLSRRDFVRMTGCMSLGAMSLRSPSLIRTGERLPRFAYVGHTGCFQDGSGCGIGVFAVDREGWRQTGLVASHSPSFLTLHPNERFLYAIHEVDRYENLPTGIAEAFSIDERDGSLTLLNRQPMSLSATSPRHAAVSPDGGSLVVAVHGGGMYNVLPVEADGRLGRVSGILKETGSGPLEAHQESAHPQMVVFDGTGRRVVGADLGSDRLSVFTLDEGGLAVTQRREVVAGSGPRQMEFHPRGHLLFVANGLEGSVSCYGYDVAQGTISGLKQHVFLHRDRGVAEESNVVMAMHPSGRFLYTSRPESGEGIAVWGIDAETGALRAVSFESSAPVHAMTVAADGGSLLAVSRAGGGVVRWRVDPVGGRLSEPVSMAAMQTPMSLAVKYL